MYDFPELTFVTRHGCEPWEDLAVKLMLKWPGLHYSTSAFAPKHYPKAIIDYANTRGADKIIYAGYFPMGLSLDKIFQQLRDVRSRTRSGRSSFGTTPVGAEARLTRPLNGVAIIRRALVSSADRAEVMVCGHAGLVTVLQWTADLPSCVLRSLSPRSRASSTSAAPHRAIESLRGTGGSRSASSTPTRSSTSASAGPRSASLTTAVVSSTGPITDPRPGATRPVP